MRVFTEENDIPLLREYFLVWGKENFQNFPWRTAKNPYGILVAELMLHRTQAKQVIPVYLRLMGKFPSLHMLINAQASEIEDIFSPLGLQWRVTKVFQLLQILQKEYHSEIPSSKEELMKLPGISEYISSAVVCFGFGEPVALIDINTVRITCRLHGIPYTDSLRRNKKFVQKVNNLLDIKKPEKFNYAMIDFAHKICKAKNPLCTICVLNDFCSYFSTKMKF